MKDSRKYTYSPKVGGRVVVNTTTLVIRCYDRNWEWQLEPREPSQTPPPATTPGDGDDNGTQPPPPGDGDNGNGQDPGNGNGDNGDTGNGDNGNGDNGNGNGDDELDEDNCRLIPLPDPARPGHVIVGCGPAQHENPPGNSGNTPSRNR